MLLKGHLQAGYAYELAFRQFEGRPDKVVLLFDRKLLPSTPGGFMTRVVTRGVDP